ncbi:MAG: S8 family peptidase [Anaerolineae bacterium]
MDPSKLHPTLRTMVEVDMGTKSIQEMAQEPKDYPVIVRYRSAVSRSMTADVQAPVTQTFDLINAAAMTVNLLELNDITEDPNVALVWADLPVHTMLDTSVPIIRAPEVWAAGFTGRGVTIAIVDTGVDTEHPDLVGRVAEFKDFTGQGNNDGNGHGTHVASIAAGSGAASDGKYRGVAPDATIIAARVLDSSGSGSQSNVMAGIEWAVERGARVINMSLGGPPEPSDGTDALSAQVDAAVRAGVVCCVAAGNSGRNGAKTVGSPGGSREAITIGATVSDPANAWDEAADFSSRGPTADGRVKPDVCLPGYQITAARGKGTTMGTPVDDHYTTASGTSMATPHATGAVALLLQSEPTLTPAQVKERMMRAGRSMGLDPNTQGTGRVDVRAFFRGQAGEPLPGKETPTPTPTPTPVPAPASGCLPVFLVSLLGR